MDRKTFENKVFIFRDEMYRFAKSLLKSEDDAKDVVQEILVKAWKEKDRLENYNNVKAYVMRSVKNQCFNRLKHEKVKLNYALQVTKPKSINMITNNLEDQILSFIKELPEKQRLVIHLKDVEEYNTAEIADLLEMNENAVRINLKRARDKVKEKIKQLYNYENQSLGR